MSDPLFVGIDLGTSGARAVTINRGGDIVAKGQMTFATPGDATSPLTWWSGVEDALLKVISQVPATDIAAISVSATSGTVMALDDDLVPLAQVFMYNDPCPNSKIIEKINDHAPDWSPTKGSTGDSTKEPREVPRAPDDVIFLKGLLEDISSIEAAAYSRLAELGAPQVTRIFATSGGSENLAWSQIRARILEAPLERPLSTDAAFGCALLARKGAGFSVD